MISNAGPAGVDDIALAEAYILVDHLEQLIQQLSEQGLASSCVDAVLFLRHQLQQFRTAEAASRAPAWNRIQREASGRPCRAAQG